MNWTLFYVIDKAHMVCWMPVERIESRIEFHRVDEFVYRENYLKIEVYFL